MTAAEYDLTSTLAEYMDIHLALPLLEFLQKKNVRRNKTTLACWELIGVRRILRFTQKMKFSRQSWKC